MTKYPSKVKQMSDCTLLNEHNTVNKDQKGPCSRYLKNSKIQYYDFLVIILVSIGYLLSNRIL
mgnify:CR=1 FL=1